MTGKIVELADCGAELVIKEYRERMGAWRTFVPDLVLAGGAIRDVLFGRPVKDMDLLSAYADAPVLLGDALGGGLRPCLAEREEGYGAEGHLVEVYETGDRAINLLIVTDVLGRIEEFPGSISKVWFDGESVWCTKDFINTRDDGTIRTYERMTPERQQRLLTKYPDFSFEEATS